jgi:hypothetical protein
VLVERGALNPSLKPSEATDFVYLLMSPDAYRIMTIERGWKPETFQQWLAHALCTTLLAP